MPHRPGRSFSHGVTREPGHDRLGRPDRLSPGDGRDRSLRRLEGQGHRELLPRQPAFLEVADDRPELRHRHPRRDARLSGRGRVWDGRLGNLVPVEEPVRHALLLDHGADLPADSPHDPGRDDRGPLRPLDGRDLHGVRPQLLHDQHRGDAEGRGQGDQPGDRRRDRCEHGRPGHDRDLPSLQLRRGPGGLRLDGLLPGLSHHRAVLHAHPSGPGSRGRDGGAAGRRWRPTSCRWRRPRGSGPG